MFTDPWGFGFEYEYQPGEPMGRAITAPFVRILATEENQTVNTYRTVKFNLTDDDCPLSEIGADVGKWSAFLPGGGEIRTSTASASSKDGGLETAAIADETHLYDTPELREMRDIIVANLWKRQQGAGTLLLETTTMFAPGDNSAAEQTFLEAEAIESGKKRNGAGDVRLYYDHRWGDCPDLGNEEMLRKAIRDAYGDAMAWMNEDSLVAKVFDTRTSPGRVRRFMLNAQTPSVDAWLAPHEIDACGDPTKELRPGDVVVLGGDGSIRDDATAIVACRLDDGHMELIGVWEKPEGAGDEWQVDREAVDACIAQAMRDYDVVGFYMDPPHWADYLDRWHNEFAERMQVQATRNRPLEWWTNRPTQMVQALERFHEAVIERRVSFTPAEDRVGEKKERARTFRTHMVNARRNPTRSGMQIRKEFPKSPKKIDSCVAAVIAWECRNDAVAGGAGPSAADFFLPKRIR